MSCPYCGGRIYGNGYTSPLVCENALAPVGALPRSGPWFCDGGASTGAERSGAAQRGPQAAPRTAGGSPPFGGGGRGEGDEARPGYVLDPVTLAWVTRESWETACACERLGAAGAAPRKRGLDASQEIDLTELPSPRFTQEFMDRVAPRYVRPIEQGFLDL